MQDVQQQPGAFVPLTDDEIMELIEQGLGHLLRPYRVGVSCEHRGTRPSRWPAEAWCPTSQRWREVA